MHKKTKSPLDGVVSDYTLQMLFIILTLTLQTLLFAKVIPALSPFVEEGKSFQNFEKNLYLDKHSLVNAVTILRDGKYIVLGSF